MSIQSSNGPEIRFLYFVTTAYAQCKVFDCLRNSRRDRDAHNRTSLLCSIRRIKGSLFLLQGQMYLTIESDEYCCPQPGIYLRLVPLVLHRGREEGKINFLAAHTRRLRPMPSSARYRMRLKKRLLPSLQDMPQ